MSILNKAKDFILDILFPISCIYCGKENNWLCEECLDKIPQKQEWVCPICEKNITPGGRVCFQCRKKSLLDGLLVASSYKNKIISSAVHYYKYRFADSIAPFLGKILIKSLLSSGLPLPDFIIPVPLHRRRLRWRGFNQSELLADYLGKNLTPGFPIPFFNNLLIRKKYTPPQMKIKSYSRRQKNIRDAFEFNNNSDDLRQLQQLEHYNNYNILLVDDIATTGATLFECARVLKESGAKEIFAIVVARQEQKTK